MTLYARLPSNHHCHHHPNTNKLGMPTGIKVMDNHNPMLPKPRDDSWPPKSPRDALLLTPRGRARYAAMTAEQQRTIQMSPLSPSPLRHTRPARTPSPGPSGAQAATVAAAAVMGMADDDDEEDEDDEEMLQLKLQAIEARLKLKKLQKKKAEAARSSPTKAEEKDVTVPGTPEVLGRVQQPNLPRSPAKRLLDAPDMFADLPKSPDTVGKSPARLAYARSPLKPNPLALKPLIPPPPPKFNASKAEASGSSREIEVPVSPIQRVNLNREPPLSPVQRVHRMLEATSPLRQMLSKGRRSEDVSLGRKRPAVGSSAGSTVGNESFTSAGSSSTGYLRTARAGQAKSTGLPLMDDRPLSFNERMLLAKAEEQEKAERQKRIAEVRASDFGISKEEMEKYKAEAVEIPVEKTGPKQYSREEILGLKKVDEEGKNEASFDSYSSFHLSKRILPHNVLTRHMADSKIFSISDLVKTVKAPDYELPDIEENVIVFGILAKKSEPREHQNGQGGMDEGKAKKKKQDTKYMVITLVDLIHDVELYLFGSGFTRFWKLTEGTVIAILNPNIMPPPPNRKDTGRWSFVINSDADTILEIGIARDLGYCKSIKKDGKPCAAWVNAKRTEYCEYHSNAALQKVKAGRLEMTGSGFGRGGDDWNGQAAVYQKKFGRGGSRGGFGGRGGRGGKSEWARGKGHTDLDGQATFFMSRTMSAADIMDGKNLSMTEKKEREEGVRRMMLQKEKERELAKKIASKSSGIGREYMAKLAGVEKKREQCTEGFVLAADETKDTDADRLRRKTITGALPGGATPGATVVSVAIGELPVLERIRVGDIGRGRRAEDIDLSAGKRKRADSAMSMSTVGSSASGSTGKGSGSAAAGKKDNYGWGKGLKEKLDRMKEGEKLKPAGKKRDTSPVRKRTRFVTEGGIKEAGRESFGVGGHKKEKAKVEREVDMGEVDFVLEIEGAPPGFQFE